MLKRLYLLLIFVSLGGCATQSQVTFAIAPPAPDSDVVIKAAAGGADIFTMPVSKLVVVSGGAAVAASPQKAAPSAATGAAPSSQSATDSITVNKQSYSTSVVPVEGSHSYISQPVTGFFTSTQVNISKLQNTNIPSAISSTFTDNTVTRIDQIGGILAALAPLASLGVEPPCNTGSALKSFTLTLDQQGTGTIDKQPCWTYKVTFATPTPVGAVSWKTLESSMGASVKYFPVPACRDATIELAVNYKDGAGNAQSDLKATIVTKIADPDYVRLVPLPSKGTINMHPICGADVSDSPPDRIGAGLADFGEVLKQIQTIEASSKNTASTATANPPKAAAPAPAK